MLWQSRQACIISLPLYHTLLPLCLKLHHLQLCHLFSAICWHLDSIPGGSHCQWHGRGQHWCWSCTGDHRCTASQPCARADGGADQWLHLLHSQRRPNQGVETQLCVFQSMLYAKSIVGVCVDWACALNHHAMLPAGLTVMLAYFIIWTCNARRLWWHHISFCHCWVLASCNHLITETGSSITDGNSTLWVLTTPDRKRWIGW